LDGFLSNLFTILVDQRKLLDFVTMANALQQAIHQLRIDIVWIKHFEGQLILAFWAQDISAQEHHENEKHK